MLASALILGIISSIHCIAMCGPIAMMLPLARNNPEKKALQILTYHFGRLLSYGVLGLLFGFFGKGLYLAGMQQYLSIFTGLAITLIVVLPERIFAKYNLSRPVYRMISKVKCILGNRLGKQSFKSLFTIGLLNGLLPCATIYAALFGALAMQDFTLGALYMVLFGLGTVPLMSCVTYVCRYLTISVRNKMQKIVPYAMLFIGLLFIARGLSLGIDHLSPSKFNLFVRAEAQCH